MSAQDRVSKDLHLSSSREQSKAESVILSEINRLYGLNLEPTSFLLSDRHKVQIDGLDEKNSVICEIYARVGKLKGSQPDKLASDLLKMALVEKLTDRVWRKIMCFCNESAAMTLKGRSWLATVAAHFAVEVIVVEIPEKTREALLMAQKRQKMVNRPADEQKLEDGYKRGKVITDS